jgi:hypothetical protein
MFCFLFLRFLVNHRLHGTSAWRTSDDARPDDAASDADDVLSKPNAANDATAFPVI